MHSKPDLSADDDDGTWFQPAPDGSAAESREAPVPRTVAASDAPGPRDEGPTGDPTVGVTQDPAEGPAGNPTVGLTANGDAAGGANAFPTVDFTGGPSQAGSDPGSWVGTGTGGSRESGDWDAVPPPLIETGQVVFGKYHLLEMIGEGGMGQVWRVRHVELDSLRALKLIKPEIAKNAEGWKRFRREARVMDRLGQHPNSVAIYDFKRVQSMAYIEMAFVRGQSLDKLLKENGDRPMPLPWIVSVLRQLCSVLQVAHSFVDESTGRPKPIVHRDLKPSNLMLVDNRPEGQNLKVLDFGIAKMVDDKAAEDERTMELTGASVFLGTAGYASPEQIRGDKEIDGRSDLYSTGVMLYQFLTGELPFHGSRMAMLAAHMMRAPGPMTETSTKPDVPSAIEQVVLRCLAKDPDDRYQTAAELFDAFSRAAGEPGGGLAVEPKPKRTRGPGRKSAAGTSRWPLAAAALLMIGIVGGGAAYVLMSERKSSFIPDDSVAVTPNPVSKPGAADPSPAPPPPSKPVPEGYTAVKEAGYDPDGYPRSLIRKAGGVHFYRIPGKLAYLPARYEPESANFGGDWPEVIVRRDAQDLVRFRRISGKTYVRGDAQAMKGDGAAAAPAPDPIDDREGHPCIPHRVSVSAFYIQETEVTNGEIEDYLKDKSEDVKEEFSKWREGRDKIYGDIFKSTKDEAKAREAVRLYPAVCIDYETALEYARDRKGRLPTETEWEFAAKSQLDDRMFAWGMDAPNDANRKAHLRFGSEHSPVQVRSYDKDQTEQHVFGMGGNVREWCLDTYRPYSELVVGRKQPIKDDPESVRPGPKEDEEKLNIAVRGGSFLTYMDQSQVFNRGAERADTETFDLGFRVVIPCPSLAPAGPERID
jgi:serine/threonine-protein kinase